ncbi:MAG: tyrosine-type recombinase/integrase [Chthoniobacterales bacterium]|nr:tyrosine-type recombinase/integrase [Chthoniobacterales bacterium]
MKATPTETRDRLKADYWLPRLFHRNWAVSGKSIQAASWYVRIQCRGRRETLNLNQTDRTLAARTARDIYKKVAGAGWQSAFEDPTLRLSDPSERIIKSATVGNYIAAAADFAESTQTHSYNARSLRLIVSEQLNIRFDADEDRIAHIAAKLALAELRRRQAAGDKKAPPHGGKRHSKREKAWIAAQAQTAAAIREEAVRRLRYDYKGNGRGSWIAAVDAVPLAKLTPAAVREWRSRRLREAEKDGAGARQRADITSASVMRQAASLFSPKVVKDVRTKVDLPAVLPFDDVEIPRPENPRFEVQVPWEDILEAAGQLNDVELKKAFYLAVTCGLRRREMDTLLWDSFDFRDQRLTVKPTKDYALKTAGSYSAIPLPLAVSAFFEQCHRREQAKRGDGVLAGNRKTNLTSRSYRCEVTWQKLLAWVRAQGITDRKPIHHLRKLCGEALNRQAGIHAASRFLRHTSVRVTEASYIDSRARIAPDVSAVMGDKVISLPPLTSRSASQAKQRKAKRA